MIKFNGFKFYTGFAKIKLVYLMSVTVRASEGAATSFERMLLSPLIHYRKAYCHEMLGYLEAQKATM